MSCDPSLSDDLYADIVREPSTDPWFWTICLKLAPVTVSNSHHAAQLSSACLNARSILPKRFDIFAFICAFHIDILAVTWMTLLVMEKFVQDTTNCFVVTAPVMVGEFLS